MTKGIQVYQQEITIEPEKENTIEMRKIDYDRMMNDMKQMNDYFFHMSGKTFEEYKKEQEELKALYSNPLVGSK